jgi:hypothetical protein
LRGTKFPASRARILSATKGKLADGWEVSYFLTSALTCKEYATLRSVMIELESWLEKQG